MKKKRVFSFLLTLILAFNIGFSFQGSTNVDAASKKYVIKINKQMNCVTIYEKKIFRKTQTCQGNGLFSWKCHSYRNISARREDALAHIKRTMLRTVLYKNYKRLFVPFSLVLQTNTIFFGS